MFLALSSSDRVNSNRLHGDYSFGDFWDDYGILVIVVLVSLIAATILFLPDLIRKRKKRIENDSVPLPNYREKVYRPLVRTVNLHGFDPVQIKKGDVFYAPVPEKDGYTFAGWFYDSACTVPYLNKKISKDVMLYPKWVKHG